MTKVIVTGGAGFIGSNVVDGLVAEGYEVHVIDNLSAGKKENVHPRAILHIVDIRKIQDITPIIKGARYVFHLAAVPSVPYSIEHPQETNEVNVNGTLNVLQAAHQGRVLRVIYSASASAYGDEPTLPHHETMSPHPISPYGLQKYIGELYCRLWSEVYGLQTVSLRYFNLYGPRQNAEGAYASVIAKFLKQKANKEALTIVGNGSQTRDFIHVNDVVAANLLAAKSKKVGTGEVINIGSGKDYSVQMIAELIGGKTKRVAARHETKKSRADITRAKKLLGWKPKMSIEEGIAELKNDLQ